MTTLLENDQLERLEDDARIHGIRVALIMAYVEGLAAAYRDITQPEPEAMPVTR